MLVTHQNRLKISMLGTGQGMCGADETKHYFIVCKTCAKHLKVDAIADKIVRPIFIVPEESCIMCSTYNNLHSPL